MTDINRTTDGICIYKPKPCSKVVAQSDRIWSKFSIERKEKKSAFCFYIISVVLIFYLVAK